MGKFMNHRRGKVSVPEAGTEHAVHQPTQPAIHQGEPVGPLGTKEMAGIDSQRMPCGTRARGSGIMRLNFLIICLLRDILPPSKMRFVVNVSKSGRG